MARVLLIEDDDAVRSSLARILALLGHAVTEARNGKEGLELFSASGADLVITDLVMPEKEGLEVMMEIKKTHPNTRIIAISGGGRRAPGDILKIARHLGAARVLAKPMSFEEIKTAVTEVLAT
jgi:YesN/AraC family two-component response regulator